MHFKCTTNHLRILFLISFLQLLPPTLSPASADNTSSSPETLNQAPHQIEIMSYNLENLFDTVHDEGKNDWTFTPKNHPEKKKGCMLATSKFYRQECFTTDWNEQKLAMKLEQIKEVISKERKVLPDLLAVSEVENDKVLSLLASKLGYKKFAITNSPDERGIDVGLMFNENSALKLLKVIEHNLKEEKVLENETRNILEVVFKLKNDYVLSVFVNHWPSQGNPTEDRLSIAQYLVKVVEERIKDPYHKVIAVGDFNTTLQDNPHPFSTVLTHKQHGPFKDVYEQLVSAAHKSQLPQGSHYFSRNGTWSFLDRIFVSENLVDDNKSLDGPKVMPGSFEVYSPDFITEKSEWMAKDESAPREEDGSVPLKKVVKKIPKRYNFKTEDKLEAGYSDHFPLVIKLSLK